MAHRATDVAVVGVEFGHQLAHGQRLERHEIEVFGQQVEHPQREPLLDRASCGGHRFGEHDHELSPIAAGWIAGLHDPVFLAGVHREDGHRLFPRTSHVVYTTTFVA